MPSTTHRAVYGLGERAPRVTFDGPELADLAYLTGAALALAERPRRFRFQAGADGRLHLMHDGAGVATVHSAGRPGRSHPGPAPSPRPDPRRRHDLLSPRGAH